MWGKDRRKGRQRTGPKLRKPVFLEGEKEKWLVWYSVSQSSPFRIFNQPNVQVLGLWKDTRVSRGKSHTENIETLQKTAGRMYEQCRSNYCILFNINHCSILVEILCQSPGLDYLISAWLTMTIVYKIRRPTINAFKCWRWMSSKNPQVFASHQAESF